MKATSSRFIIPAIFVLILLCACLAAGGYWFINRSTDDSIGEVVQESYCIGEGQVLQVLDENGYGCCAGLNPEPFTHPVTDDPSGCSFRNENTRICINCGDGICGEGEDQCICPADCGM